VALWLDNEESSQRYWRETARETWDRARADETFTRREWARIALAARLKEETEDANPLSDRVNLYADLLGAALSEVSWDDIAESWLNDFADEATE
jgi:hypothetical protein